MLNQQHIYSYKAVHLVGNINRKIGKQNNNNNKRNGQLHTCYEFTFILNATIKGKNN